MAAPAADRRIADPAAYVLTYVLAPHELRVLRQRLARAGFLDASPPPSPQQPAATPAPSLPATPTALAHHVDVDASLLDDEYLPLTSRRATRTALTIAAVQAAYDLLRYGRANRTLKGSSSVLGRRILKSGLGTGLFVAMYRTFLQLLVLAQAKVLAPRVAQWKKEYLPAPRSQPTRPAPSRRSSSVSLHGLTASGTGVPDKVEEESHRERFLRRVLGVLESGSLIPSLAAILSAPSLALLPPGVREYFALDAFVKSIKFLVDDARLTNHGPLAKIPRWVGASLVFALANGELVWATLFERDTVNRLYGNLLLSRSSAYIQPRPQNLPHSIPWPSQQRIIDTIAFLSTPKKKVGAYPAYRSPLLAGPSALKPSSEIEVINPLLDYAPAHPGHTSLLCAVLHPNDPSCASVWLQFWRKEWPSNLKLVGLALGLWTLARFKTLVQNPEDALFRFGMGSVQSATFMTGFVGSLWATHCFLQEWLPRTLVPKARYFLNGAIASLFMFALPTAWRGLPASYAARYSLFSSFQILKKRRMVRPLKYGDLFLIALCLSVLAPLYEEKPKSLDRNYRRIFSFLIGPRQGSEGFKQAQTAEKEPRDYFLAKAKLRSLSTIHPPPSGKGEARTD